MSRPILAIHISTGAITALLLDSGLKRGVVESCAHIALDPAGADDPLGTALEELKSRLKTEGAALAVSIPLEQVIFRNLTVPFKDLKKIAQILPFELEATLPVAVESLEITFQAQIIGEAATVLAAAVDRSYLTGLIDTFARAGLKPELIVPGTYPLLHALWAAEQLHEHYVWLDFDEERAALFALVHKNISLARSFPLAGEEPERTQALALKIQQSLTALAELHALDYAPTRLYVSGILKADAHELKLLEELLAIPLQIVDLCKITDGVDLKSDTVHTSAEFFDAALALAVLAVQGNAVLYFHRTGSALRNLWSSYKRYLKTPAILLTLLLILALGSVVTDIYLLQSRLDRIEKQINSVFLSVFPDTTRIVDPLLQMQTRMDEYKRSSLDPTQTGEQVHCTDILQQISRLIPKETEVVLNRMTYGSDGVTLAGETAGFNTVDDIKNRLEKSELFSKVTIAAANMDKMGNKVLFRLKIDL